jgi:hypothetical protein
MGPPTALFGNLQLQIVTMEGVPRFVQYVLDRYRKEESALNRCLNKDEMNIFSSAIDEELRRRTEE